MGINNPYRALPYNPVTSLSGVVLWLRADMGITTSSGEVTQWADQSGIGDSGRNFSPITDRPAWNATDALYNNQPTVGTFNKAGIANNCRLRSSTWNSTYYIFSVIVYGHTIATSNRYFTYEQSSNFVAVTNNATSPYVFSGAGDNSINGSAGTGPTNAPKLMIAEFNGTSSKLFVNAVSTATVTGTLTAATIGSAALTIGTYGGTSAATSFSCENIAEALVLNGAWSDLSTAQKTSFGNYINARYAQSITT